MTDTPPQFFLHNCLSSSNLHRQCAFVSMCVVQADDHCLSTTQLLRQQSPVSWSNRRRQRQYIDSESQQGSHASLKASNTLNKPGLSSSSDRAPSSALALDSGRNRNRNTHTLSSDSSDPCSITALQSSNPFDLADPSFDWRNHQFWPLSAKPQAAATSPLDINQTYSAIVDGLKKLLRQLQAQGGMTHDLEHEFDRQTDAVVSLLHAKRRCSSCTICLFGCCKCFDASNN